MADNDKPEGTDQPDDPAAEQGDAMGGGHQDQPEVEPDRMGGT